MWSLGLYRNIPGTVLCYYVVTWSMQEHSCGHLVSVGIFLQGPVLLCGHLVCAGICLQSQNPLIYVHAHA